MSTMPKVTRSDGAANSPETKGCRLSPTTRPLSRQRTEIAVYSMHAIWQRLLKSYQCFSQSDAVPFVVPDATLFQSPEEGSLDRSSPAPAPGPSQGSYWKRECPIDVLIAQLYVKNEALDRMAWLIAFCLLDRLQLNHYVQQRLHHITFWTPEASTTFRLPLCDVSEILFTLYGVALKWHLDYSVSLSYLLSLLPPCRPDEQQSLLRETGKKERYLLCCLNYNCWVSPSHLFQLLDHFLTSAERDYFFQVISL